MLARIGNPQLVGVSVGILAVAALTSCASAPDKLHIASTTIIGLDASFNSARTSGRVQIGYDRYFLTWVPKSVEAGDQRSTDVMSVLNCTEVQFGQVSVTKFVESLAAGNAAVKFAEAIAKESQENVFSCFSKAEKGPSAGSDSQEVKKAEAAGGVAR